MIVWAWPVKRVVFARLAKVSSGEIRYNGCDALVSVPPAHPVQVELFLPDQPDRITVFGTPVAFSRREITGEGQQSTTAQSVAVGTVESDRIEVRIRVFEPGEDYWSVDQTIGDVANAVTTAVMAEPFGTPQMPIHIYLSGGTQDPTALAPAPEPSVTGNVSLTFTAEVISF